MRDKPSNGDFYNRIIKSSTKILKSQLKEKRNNLISCVFQIKYNYNDLPRLNIFDRLEKIDLLEEEQENEYAN